VKKIVKVYVAGAYSDNNVIGVLKNIGRGEEIASKLFLKRYAPFTPWHDKDYVIKHWREDMTIDMFYNYSMAWLHCSDCILIVPNVKGLKDWEQSSGTIAEIEEAKKNNIPVFYTIEDMETYYNEVLV